MMDGFSEFLTRKRKYDVYDAFDCLLELKDNSDVVGDYTDYVETVYDALRFTGDLLGIIKNKKVHIRAFECVGNPLFDVDFYNRQYARLDDEELTEEEFESLKEALTSSDFVELIRHRRIQAIAERDVEND